VGFAAITLCVASQQVFIIVVIIVVVVVVLFRHQLSLETFGYTLVCEFNALNSIVAPKTQSKSMRSLNKDFV
jgi:hypothetical protein